jgi:hypothetical protein
MAWQERIPQLNVKNDSKILINIVLDKGHAKQCPWGNG